MRLAAAIDNPIDLFAPAFAQRALLAVLLLAALSALLGWAIILRDLPFFTHAVGGGAYPVLVLGAIVGASTALASLAGATIFALCLLAIAGVGGARGSRVDPGRRDALIGLAVAAALAIGTVIAAGRRGGAPVSPEGLLFGSLLTIDDPEIWVLTAVVALAAPLTLLLSARWLAAGFDPAASGQLSSWRSDAVLFACVALAVGAALPVTGALLAGALLIVPAATARLIASRAQALPPLTLLLALTYGLLGLYGALAFDLPTGASIAAVAGAGFVIAAAARRLADRGLPSGRTPALAATLLAALLLGGCGGTTPVGGGGEDGPLRVVATTPQVADIVRQVGGDAVSVTTMLPAGEDPHSFEPRPSAIAALGKAGAIFRSGGDIDAWLTPAVKSAGAATMPVDLSRAAILLAGANGAAADSHWFLDPENVARAAQKVRDTLVKADPSARETFRTNTTAYLDEIDRVRTQLNACLATIPQKDRSLAGGHGDFKYLADAFGLRLVAISDTAAAEPNARELDAALRRARAAGVRALLSGRGETSALEREFAAKLGVPLLALYSDNLTDGDDASTLLGAIAYDVGRIADSVSGGTARCPAAK